MNNLLLAARSALDRLNIMRLVIIETNLSSCTNGLGISLQLFKALLIHVAEWIWLAQEDFWVPKKCQNLKLLCNVTRLTRNGFKTKHEIWKNRNESECSRNNDFRSNARQLCQKIVKSNYQCVWYSNEKGENRKAKWVNVFVVFRVCLWHSVSLFWIDDHKDFCLSHVTSNKHRFCWIANFQCLSHIHWFIITFSHTHTPK